VRPFVNKEERLAVDGVLRNSGRRPRLVVSDEPCEVGGAASTATASSEVHEAGRLFRLQSEPMEACASELDIRSPHVHLVYWRNCFTTPRREANSVKTSTATRSGVLQSAPLHQ
jgi:hypothetical protein